MSATDEVATAAGDAGILMDRVYRHQRHIYDLTRKCFLLGRDHLISRLDPPRGGTVLELGCGTGRNLIAAAALLPETRLFGLDVSAEMLNTARRNAARAGLDGQIVFARADASACDPRALFGVAGFDSVYFSYSLSMIPAWQQALEIGLRALRNGGVLHVVDFGQQERLPRIFKAGLFAWLRAFHVSPRAGLRTALAALAATHRSRLSFAPLYRGYAWYAEVIR